MGTFDENGWLTEPLEPLPTDAAYSLLAPEVASRIDTDRWCDQAHRLFGAVLAVTPQKRYPSGGWPVCDRADVALVAEARVTRVRVITLPLARASEVQRAAYAGATAIGGAGFDVLVGRAQRIWQVAAAPLEGDDPRAPLVVAGMLAAVLLAPLLPPGGGTIFGLKGARERLARQGWK